MNLSVIYIFNFIKYWMLVRQERIALALLIGVALIIIAAHGLLSALGKYPFARPFTNTTPDGELVFFNGTIESVSISRTGGHVTLHISNQTVFIPSEAAAGMSFRKDGRIVLFGTVQTWHGKKEIVVGSAEDIRLVQENATFRASPG